MYFRTIQRVTLTLKSLPYDIKIAIANNNEQTTIIVNINTRGLQYKQFIVVL